MAVDAETIIKLAPREYRPTLIAGFMIGALVVAYFIFLSGPIKAATAGVQTNKDAIATQAQVSAQAQVNIVRRLSNIENQQADMNGQLGELKGQMAEQTENQKMILQFLLTGQRPKLH